MQSRKISIIGLEGFPLIKAGDDLARIIVETARTNTVSLNDGDVVVIAQKIVSKSEGRLVRLRDVEASDTAQKMARVSSKDPRFIELVLEETKRILKHSSEILIVENEQGLVCINAGIDKSNVSGQDTYALLPRDPDESARRIKSEIMRLTGKKVAVIISDTYSRPFRKGQVEFAIGIAGVSLFKDYRGQKDLFDYLLRVKYVALVDELASAAELVMGQGREAIPVAIVRNMDLKAPDEDFSMDDLWISREEDLFTGAF